MIKLYSDKPESCPECGSSLIILDDNSSEIVCKKCGLVIQDQPCVGKVSSPLVGGRGFCLFSYDDRCFIRNQHHNLKPRFVNRNVKRFLDVQGLFDSIASSLQMTGEQRAEAWYILDNLSFKQIHSRVKIETVIAGVCRFAIVLLNPGRGRQLWFSNLTFVSAGLTAERYDIIRANVLSLYT